MVYQFIQILNSRILINIFVTMGPIEKKINEVLNTENLSEEIVDKKNSDIKDNKNIRFNKENKVNDIDFDLLENELEKFRAQKN